MGYYLSKMLSYVYSGFANESVRILIAGLNAAGKTAIVYKLKLNETVHTIPTMGFNVEEVTVDKSISFTMSDSGGGPMLRRHLVHLSNPSGIISVVDSSDSKERLQEARDELFDRLNESFSFNVPLVVMANKQDLPGACTTAELEEALDLREVQNCKWCIQACCATIGVGLWESMHQMAIMIKECKSVKATDSIATQ